MQTDFLPSIGFPADSLARGFGVSPARREAAAGDTLPCLNSITSNETSSGPSFQGVVLTAYQSRLAFSLMKNVEAFVERFGLEKIGFCTITCADDVSVAEFQRRYNSFATGVLRKLFPASIMVVERGDKSGRVHCHILLPFDCDIRTGFEHQAVKRGDYRSACSRLRAFWRLCLRKGPLYKFGRIECVPIKSNAEAVSKYVAAYIGKHVGGRRPCDRGARLVRYSGRGTMVCSTRFTFNSVRSHLWRQKLFSVASAMGMPALCAEYPTEDVVRTVATPVEDFKAKFGEKWAFHLQRRISSLTLPEYRDKAAAAADGFDVSMFPDDVIRLTGFSGPRCVSQFVDERSVRDLLSDRGGCEAFLVFSELAKGIDWEKFREPVSVEGWARSDSHWSVMSRIDSENKEYWQCSDDDGIPVIDGVLCPF